MDFNFISGNSKLSDQNILDKVEKNRKELDVLNRPGLIVNINFDCLVLNYK